MKAVFQNTMLSLLCLASVVLAAPHQSISLLRSFKNRHKPAIQVSATCQPNCETVQAAPLQAPSIEEGTVRFACW